MAESLRRQEEVFTQAIALPAEEREGFLERACAGDVRLRSEIEALLRAHTETLSMLEHPPGAAATPDEQRSGPPRGPIGPYSIVRKLGEGGTGVVYEAQQTEPVARTVALKVMKAGTDTRSAVARFETERRALALMDHPNIAHVFDAGSTAGGHLYFAMEYVRGTRITDYCDDNLLPTRDRLALIVQVCHAVQHAHQKGVIHRDLKPSNVLVTTVDGQPVPKVIDFGIAKAIQGTLSEQLALTQLEQVLGTPAYMSPEQAAGIEVDTRSDIYSLGALLYELMTGRTPLDTAELIRHGIDAVKQAIREQDPQKPSDRLRTTSAADLATIASHRQCGPERLVHAIRGDLDWIVLRALARDPARRYPAANDLAADIERHLRNEAVFAGPPGTWYHLRKFIRRHCVGIATGTTLALALCVALAATWIAYRRTAAALAESDATVEFLEDTLAAADPNRLGFDVTVRKVLDAASPAVARDFADRPLLQARLDETIGRTFLSLGAGPAAEPHLRSATQLRRKTLGPRHPLTLRAQARWSAVAPDPVEAATLLNEVLRAYEAGDDYPALDVVYALRSASGRLAHAGRLDEALDHARKAVQLARDRIAPDDPDAAWARITLAVTHWYRGEFAAARDEHYGVIALNLPHDNPAWRYAFGGAGLMELQLGQLASAEMHTREVHEYTVRVYGPDHPMTLVGMPFYGMVLARRDRAAEGLAILEKVCEARAGSFGDRHPRTMAARAYKLHALHQLGRDDEAIATGREVWQFMRDRITEDVFVADLMADLAVIEIDAGHAPDAEDLCRDVLVRLSSLPPRPYTLSRLRIALGRALIHQDRCDEAERELLANDAVLEVCPFDVREQRRSSAQALVVLYERWPRPEHAATWSTRLAALPAPE